jgi:hypothetical protein
LIAHPGNFGIAPGTLGDLSAIVLRSYRLVGITDAALLEIEKTTLNGGLGLRAKLAYKWRDQELRSNVLVSEATDAHYILTMVYLADGEAVADSLFDTIIQGVVLKSTSTGSKPESGNEAVSSGTLPLILVALAGGIGLLLAWKLHRSKQSSRR